MLVVEIDGVDRADDIDALSMAFDLNERATASLQCGPDYIPANRTPFVAYRKDGTTPIFGGVVMNRKVSGIADQALEDITDVDIADWAAYTDWAYITVSYPGDVALEDVLADLAAELAVYGITYTPTATGITVAGPFSWEDQRISDALRDLFTRIAAQRFFRFTPAGALEAIVPGAVAAPYSITDAAPHCSALSWQDSPQLPANRVILRCGPTGTALATQRWLADGVATSWVTDIPAAVKPALVQVDPPAAPAYLATVGAPGDAAAMFIFTVATSTLSLGTHATPVAGTTLVLGPTIAAGDPFETDGFTAIYPFRVARPTSPPAVPITVVIPKTDIVDYAAAVATAEGILAQLDQGELKELTIHTIDDGFEIGQLLSVNLTTARGSVVGSFLITAVTIALVRCNNDAGADPDEDYWEYVLTAIGTTTYQGCYLVYWRQSMGGGGGAVALGSGVGVATTVLSSPVYLGGTDRVALPAAAVTDWVDVYNVVPYDDAESSFTGRVRVLLWAREPGVGVTARLYNETDLTAVQSSEVVSQVPVPATILSPILVGKTYRLQVKGTTGSGAVWANGGTLKAA